MPLVGELIINLYQIQIMKPNLVIKRNTVLSHE
jgi:hypothetical protein